MQVIARLCALVVLAASLGGCMQTLSGGSIAGGESKVFERPPYVVKGKAPYDQNWIDSQIEGGIAAYGWKRPAPRPASLDAPTARKVAAPVKKRGVLKRIKDRVTHPFTKQPATPFVPQVPTPFADRFAPALPAPLPPKPRDRVEELLRP